MNTRFSLLIAILCPIVLSTAPRVVGQESPAPPEGMGDMAEMMEKWLATTKPGEGHKFLDQFVGSWTTTSKFYWGGPSDPIETHGTSEITWVLDGRFIMDQHEGQVMLPDAAGQMKAVPHKGIGLTGFDNYRNMFVGVWMDNMGTHMLTMKGAKDPSSKTLTMYGDMDEPMLDITGRTIKYVTRIIDKDKHVFELYDLAAGDDHKVVEVTYERKK